MGELKKRIGKYNEWFIKDILEIINEARKEFPMHSDGTLSFGFDVDNMKIFDVRDWFVKWFGVDE
jgi:hypothetical protein